MRDSSKFSYIKICSWPGCKAWASEKIARELEGMEMEGVKVCRVACMRKCGGGATIQVASSSEVLKMRTFEDALDALIPESLSPVLC